MKFVLAAIVAALFALPASAAVTYYDESVDGELSADGSGLTYHWNPGDLLLIKGSILGADRDGFTYFDDQNFGAFIAFFDTSGNRIWLVGDYFHRAFPGENVIQILCGAECSSTTAEYVFGLGNFDDDLTQDDVQGYITSHWPAPSPVPLPAAGLLLLGGLGGLASMRLRRQR